MSDLPGAIVLGLDNAIALTVVRDLGEQGVPVHGVSRNADALAASSRHLRSLTRRPEGPPETWLPALIARTGAGAVLALSETDLLALSLLPARIGDCVLLAPSRERLLRVIDKMQTLEVAATLGLHVPETWQPLAGEDFGARAAALPYPLVAKWANPPEVAPLLEQAGLAWIKTDYVHDAAQLLALLDRYAPIGRWPLIQRYCPGVGLGQMFHMEAGLATLRFQHRRLHEWPPEGGISTLCRAEPGMAHAAQMALSEALLRALDWEGPAMVEYRHDTASGRYWLMEVNGRYWGSLPLARHCGARFAWEAYRRAVLGDKTPAAAPRDDLRARYMVPETKRLGRILFQPGRIGDPFFRRRPIADLIGYVAGFLDPRARYYVFSGSDPRPFLNDMTQIFRKVLRREKR